MSQKDLDKVDELINISKVLNLKTKVEVLRFINKRIPVNPDKLDWRRLYYLRSMYLYMGIYNKSWNLMGIEKAKDIVLNL